jgi:hypothetical protein
MALAHPPGDGLRRVADGLLPGRPPVRSFGRERGASPEAAPLLFVALNVLFVTLVAHVFEVNEKTTASASRSIR